MNEGLKMLVEHLKNSGSIKSNLVEETMLWIDRADFCPDNPYQDRP